MSYIIRIQFITGSNTTHQHAKSRPGDLANSEKSQYSCICIERETVFSQDTCNFRLQTLKGLPYSLVVCHTHKITILVTNLCRALNPILWYLNMSSISWQCVQIPLIYLLTRSYVKSTYKLQFLNNLSNKEHIQLPPSWC